MQARNPSHEQPFRPLSGYVMLAFEILLLAGATTVYYFCSALLVVFINVIGGLIIGMVQHDMSAGAAADSYILLAVGDALVAQIPAMLISVAAAMCGSMWSVKNANGRVSPYSSPMKTRGV